MPTISSDDAKKSLSSLRKFYFNLQKSASGSEGESGFTLVELLIAEAIRRREKQKIANQVCIKQILQLVAYLDKNFKSEIAAEQNVREASLQELARLLKKTPEILDQFDENFAGYFYQFSCESARRIALDRIQSADKKSEKEDLIHFTQLYTPRWIAEYLAANAILPRWQFAAEKQTSFDSVFKREQSSETSIAANLRIIDPAAGSGHLLLPAFDLLYELHQFEGLSAEFSTTNILNHCIHGTDLDSQALWVCGFALALKALSHLNEEQGANFLQSLSLNLTDVSDASKNNTAVETGSLKREWKINHLLSKKYDAVISNPPYIGRRLLDRRLKHFLKTEYPTAHNDISAAFLVRALELCKPSGRVSFITQSSLLFLPSYGELRKELLKKNHLLSVVELGTGVFPLVAGEKINSMLIVLEQTADTQAASKLEARASIPEARKKQSSPAKSARDSIDSFEHTPLQSSNRSTAEFLDISKCSDKQHALQLACAENLEQKFQTRTYETLAEHRASAFNYKCPPILQRIMNNAAKLGQIAEVKQGLATSDNDRFVRFWWDVLPDEIGIRWHPYIKGAGSERWHAVCQTVVDWGKDGSDIKAAVETNYPYLKGKTSWVVKNEQYYFREGLTFSFVSTGAFAVRKMTEGSIFDVGGSSLFFENQADLAYMLSYLNSSFAGLCIALLNPTFNCQVGDIKQVPLLQISNDDRKKLERIAHQALQAKETIQVFDETRLHYSPDKRITQLLKHGDAEKLCDEIIREQNKAASQLESLEHELDTLILSAIKEGFQCTPSEFSTLKSIIIEKQNAKQKTRLLVQNEREFSELVIRQFLRQQENAIKEIELESPFPEMRKALQNWLENALESSLSNYISSKLNKTQQRIFANSPQFICRQNAPKKIVVVSNLGLRRLLYNKSETHKLSEPELHVFRELDSKLEKHAWTGKQLHRILME